MLGLGFVKFRESLELLIKELIVKVHKVQSSNIDKEVDSST